jgi:hypothetical protein
MKYISTQVAGVLLICIAITKQHEYKNINNLQNLFNSK